MTTESTDFDDRARTWDDDPAKVERGRVVARSVVEAVAPGSATRLLEYGAGTGLTAQRLAAEVGAVTLADPSGGMREVMAEKLAVGVFPEGTRIWDLDLTSDPVPDERFDLVVTVMTLHHIVELTPVLTAFAELLSDGGHLCIVDLEEDTDGAFHRDRPGFDGHHGFDREDLAARLEAAGFVDIRFTHCLDVNKPGGPFPVFLATAVIRAA
jgi:ubiquinone/menaquinone biosynthesis C-methylase UbiE